MSAGERVMNAAGGAVKGGITWGVVGIGIALLLSVGLPVLGALLAGSTAGWIVAAGVAGGTLGIMSIPFLGSFVAGTGYTMAGLGVLKGVFSGLFGRNRDPEIAGNEKLIQELSAQAALEEAKTRTVLAQQQRALAMGEMPNPDARTDHAQKIAREAAAQQAASAAPAVPTI